jgi:CRISPR-associated protein Cmr6
MNTNSRQTVTNPHRHIPRAFRSQIEGRCQLQRITKQEHDAIEWVDEWTTGADAVENSEREQIGSDTRSQEYQISWRFVTNSGQDDTVIRPVIGKLGIPFYPGSSMKGAFRRVCSPEQITRYCGRNVAGGDFAPGILRFHGGYPINDDWQDKLIDIVHPQQNWQVKDRTKEGGAFCQISLYKPLLEFTISSNESLSDAEWETIWQLWGAALDLGIGCRVSAGYGRVETQQQPPLYSCSISGEGGAAKIFDVGAEFRPNMFKAAIRGHALRIFSGLTTSEHAERTVDELFGGIARDSTKVGLLGINFVEQFPPRIEMFGPGRWQVPTYEVTGQLMWNLTTTLPEAEQQTLLLLIRNLTRFAMIFGGFGKSWRRADHRIFLPSYNDDGTREKALIGCHWKWGNKSLKNNYMVREVPQISGFIDRLRDNASSWLTLKGMPLANSPANWRETWHPDRVQVWARPAYDDGDSLAVRWFHGEYTRGQSIARSNLTGSTNLVGRIWHRMYPVVELAPSKKDPQVTIARPTDSFLEIVTIFPDRNIPQCQPFLQYLQQQGEFTKVWGN